AIPSPTWRTVPTSARSVSTSYCSIRWRRIDVISSGRSFKVLSSSLHEFGSQSFQSPADARVDAERARLEDDAADEGRVDLPRRLDLAAGRVLDLLQDRLRLGVAQLARRRQLDGQPPLLARHQPLELLRDLLDLARAALLRRQLEEVREQRLGVAGEVGEDRRLLRRLELRVAEDGAELRRLGRRGREVGQRLVHGRKPAGVLRRAEESLGVDAVRDGQGLGALLQAREVEAGDRLGDQLLVALRVERPADDPRRRLERQVGDLVADLLESARRLGGDLLARLLEPPLPLGLRLLAHPLLHRLARLARLGEDRLRLATRLADQLLVLLEQPLRLVARLVRRRDRPLDVLAPLVEHVLDRAEGELPQDEE